MTTTIENYNGEEFEITTYFSQEFRGRGGWNIDCEVSFKGNEKTFRHYTTDSIFIDEISDMKADNASWDEIQNAYKEKVFDSMEESILEWCESIVDSKKKFKIQIAETKSGNQHKVNGQDEFNNISDAIKKALSERERLLSQYGTIEDKAKLNGWDEDWCHDNCTVLLELIKSDDEDGVQELDIEDYADVDEVLMKEFKSKFHVTEWATCLTHFFYYSK